MPLFSNTKFWRKSVLHISPISSPNTNVTWKEHEWRFKRAINAEEEHITGASVIYQGIEDDPWVSKEELRSIISQAVILANNQNVRGSSRHTTLLEILSEFDISYKAIFSLRAIGVVKVNEEEPLSSAQIRSNINKLKSKLKKNTSTLYQHLFSAVNRVSTDELTWKVPLGSQVIADESDIIKKLPKQLRENFMKPVQNMVPTTLPGFIRKKCNEFVRDFASRDTNKLPRALLHDGRWKESNEKLAEITDGILETLNDSWNNSAFSPEEAEVLNEGTYLTNLIVPAIRASLKNLPHGKFTYISTYERQSIASADRRKRSGRRPDIIFVMMDRGKKYELMYTECSRLFCTEQKIKDDAVKIWRETNDGMYWVYKGRRPEKDEFGIIGLQVAGSILRLTVLIRDGANVDRYYHLHESRIPVQKSEPAVVAKFIETLLILRNILIVNMSLLPHGSTPKSDRQKEDSTTVDSE
ncbi:hypothetical protein RhiirA5_504674 [Rhizophagus irregularis]|uniref:Uncharacterized protein n=1 Tax=Rhizophagus irregularis TaxID=588596 RepID=A0A2N0P3B9_9GLOM|nr:hypothetical protein RhiirA5_504674 [Rhizophagus irregularis]PKC69971.1 hypothetical protein RhiirA1_533049 [Rhizophagus irregularis]CAG8694630.1 17684_t:CDS:2 [Rhizophagus irregularis]